MYTTKILLGLLHELRPRRDVARLDDQNPSSNHQEASNQSQINSNSFKAADFLILDLSWTRSEFAYLIVKTYHVSSQSRLVEKPDSTALAELAKELSSLLFLPLLLLPAGSLFRPAEFQQPWCFFVCCSCLHIYKGINLIMIQTPLP